MKFFKFASALILSATFSCNVTNTMYMNDPKPVGEGEVDGGIGIGTGMQPKLDSVNDNGDVFFNNKYTYAPIIFAAGQVGLTDKSDLRLALHLPYGGAGFGLRVGAQFSMMPEESKLQVAVGSDFGFVFAKDTIRLFGEATPMDAESTGGLNLDFFMPVGYCWSDDFEFIVTPRYSFNGVFVRKNKFQSGSRFYSPSLFGVTFGLKVRRFYFEYSNLYFENTIIPSFGLAYTFSTKREPRHPIYYTE